MTDCGGFHEDFNRQEKVEGSSERTFGLVFAALFAAMGAVALWKGNPHWIWRVGVAVVMLTIALGWPALLKPLNQLWTALGLILFRIISPITLGVIYCGVITPISLLLRWRDNDILKRKYDPSAKSYWIERDPPGPAPETMKNQF
jgi:hypothetical protein